MKEITEKDYLETITEKDMVTIVDVEIKLQKKMECIIFCSSKRLYARTYHSMEFF